jgi:hypothetical protein
MYSWNMRYHAAAVMSADIRINRGVFPLIRRRTI